jgi:iron complex transport system ATP-binding protein
MSTPPLLEARGVTRRLGNCAILHGVDLAVAPGEILAVLGPNGAGKSTLLRLLAGERAPDEGSIHFAGRPLAAWSPAQLARRRAVLPQRPSLFFPFTVAEVIALGHGQERPDPRVVREVLGLVDLASIADRNYLDLSGGEQQRVHLGRVLAQLWGVDATEPALLLLDEPVDGLDFAHRHQALALARHWAERGTAVIIVLHDLDLAATVADRAVVLHRGEVAASGPVPEVFTADLLASVFRVRAVPPADGGRGMVVRPLG